jgi:hypothetical protein
MESETMENKYRKLHSFVMANLDVLPGKLRKKFLAATTYGETGAVNITALLVVILLACVCFIILANMIGPMSTANATVQALTATDAGTVNTKMIVGLLLWIIPLGLGIALLIRVLKSHDS